MPLALHVKLADSSMSSTADQCSLPLFFTPKFKEERALVVTSLDSFDIIFGKPWLALRFAWVCLGLPFRVLHNPTIDWRTNTIHSPFFLKADAQSEDPSPRIQLISADKMTKLLTKHAASTSPQVWLATVTEILSSSEPLPTDTPPPPPPPLSSQPLIYLHHLKLPTMPSSNATASGFLNLLAPPLHLASTTPFPPNLMLRSLNTVYVACLLPNFKRYKINSSGEGLDTAFHLPLRCPCCLC